MNDKPLNILGDKPDDEEQILMCVRVEQLTGLYGSVRAECVRCRHAVWVSMSGQTAVKQNPKLQILCAECATKKMQNSLEENKFQVVPGAIEEMIRHFRKTGQN